MYIFWDKPSRYPSPLVQRPSLPQRTTSPNCLCAFANICSELEANEKLLENVHHHLCLFANLNTPLIFFFFFWSSFKLHNLCSFHTVSFPYIAFPVLFFSLLPWQLISHTSFVLTPYQRLYLYPVFFSSAFFKVVHMFSCITRLYISMFLVTRFLCLGLF